MSVPQIAPKIFLRLTPDLAGTLLMARGCAFCTVGAVWTREIFNVNENLAHFMLIASS